MAESFKPRTLIALAAVRRPVLLGGYLGGAALLALAFAIANPWLWAVVFVLAAAAGWFALQCFVELVRVILEILLPQ